MVQRLHPYGFVRNDFRHRQGREERHSSNPMTCRIDRVVSKDNRVILHISGQITGQDVDIVRAALEQEDKKVAVDLKEVLLVDGEAVKLLALYEITGVQLRNAPAYIREWVAREKAQMHTDGAK